jgi:hypothetical protein
VCNIQDDEFEEEQEEVQPKIVETKSPSKKASKPIIQEESSEEEEIMKPTLPKSPVVETKPKKQGTLGDLLTRN